MDMYGYRCLPMSVWVTPVKGEAQILGEAQICWECFALL